MRPDLEGFGRAVRESTRRLWWCSVEAVLRSIVRGFSLQRDRKGRGHYYGVAAPSSVPRRVGKLVTTRPIDAAELVQFHANGLSTIVAAADAEVEENRDL